MFVIVFKFKNRKSKSNIGGGAFIQINETTKEETSKEAWFCVQKFDIGTIIPGLKVPFNSFISFLNAREYNMKFFLQPDQCLLLSPLFLWLMLYLDIQKICENSFSSF